MKLSDLNKLTLKDLKGFDWKAIKNRVLRDPWPLYCAAAVIVSLIAVNYAWGSYGKIKIIRKTEIKDLKEQVEAVKDFNAVDDSITQFWTTVPKNIGESELIEMLSETAIKHQVQIVSFSPPRETNYKYVDITTLDITVTADDYKNAIRFMHEIEHSPYAIRVGEWQGSYIVPYKRRMRRFSGDVAPIVQKDYIQAIIEIQSLKFKND